MGAGLGATPYGSNSRNARFYDRGPPRTGGNVSLNVEAILLAEYATGY